MGEAVESDALDGEMQTRKDAVREACHANCLAVVEVVRQRTWEAEEGMRLPDAGVGGVQDGSSSSMGAAHDNDRRLSSRFVS